MNRKRGRPRKKPIDSNNLNIETIQFKKADEENLDKDDEMNTNKMSQNEKEKHASTIEMFSNYFSTLNTTSCKNNVDEKAIKTSQEKKITCAECHLNMFEHEWDEHNYNEHYTFGWKVGEVPQNKICSKKALGILKEILREKKELICKTCNKKVKSGKVYVEHKVLCNKEQDEINNKFTCGVCNMEMDKSKWLNHKYKIHANLAWRVGETPLNLNDKHLVLSILNDLYKKKKPLYCSKCGGSKKSVIGFLSHQTMCNKTEEELDKIKVECHICKKKVLPVSMTMHIKVAHTLNQDEMVIETHKEKNQKGKREAHKRALHLINEFKEEGSYSVLENSHYTFKLDFKNIETIVLLEAETEKLKNVVCKFKGCGIIYTTLKEGIEHMKNCEKKNESYFVCKHCLLMFDKEFDIRNHLLTIHKINRQGKWLIYDPDCKFDSDDENKDDNNLDLSDTMEKSESDLKVKPSFLLPKSKRKPYRIYKPAFKWTFKFYEENLNEVRLFRSIYINISDCILLEDKILDSYLPQLNYSCDIGVTMSSGFKNTCNEKINFKNYKLFQEDLHNQGNLSIFVGGPINALAWLPTPYTNKNLNQILTISILKDPNKSYLHNKNYFEKTIIQFWDFGILQNNIRNTLSAKLAFGMSHEHGPIWDMAWCPSGCYDIDETNTSRMGLLAVASSDSNVHIYSVPFLNKKQSGLFYKIKPSMTLKSGKEGSNLGSEMFYATKLSWSKVKGHNKLAVGYSNGAVSLFKLDITSSLLKYCHSFESEVILPYCSFQAHLHYITGLEILPYPNIDILVTSSFDRELYFWDLNTVNTIYLGKKKTVLTDLKWMINWMGAIYSFDEGSSSVANHIPTMITQIRDFLSDSSNIISSASTIRGISSSDWLNTVTHVTSSGEVFSFIGNQLLMGLDGDKIIKFQKLVLGTTNLVKKVKNIESSNVTLYEEAIKKYSVILLDCKKDSVRDFPKTVIEEFNEKMSPAQTKLYPLRCINKIAFNPNLQSSIFLATGYQIGLVRILPLSFLSDIGNLK